MRVAKTVVVLTVLMAVAAGFTLSGPRAAAAPQPAASPGAPAGETYTLAFPFISTDHKAAHIADPSFEDFWHYFDEWPHCAWDGFTDARGNQHPPGWTFKTYQVGETMFFPTKMQAGATVPAISGGPGEYKHLCLWQLPDTEYPWTPGAILLDGTWVYKAFGGIPQALVLSQVITGTPGTYINVVGWILGESPDQPTPPNTKLEDDHFVALVQLGDAQDKRTYAQMVGNKQYPGKIRDWNRFSVTTQFPPSGELTLTVAVQQNWPGQTDFFIDKFSGLVCLRLPCAVEPPEALTYGSWRAGLTNLNRLPKGLFPPTLREYLQRQTTRPPR